MSGAPGASSDRNLPSTAALLQRPLISGPLFGLDALGQGIQAAGGKAAPAIASTPTASDPSHRNNRGVWLSKSPLWEPGDGRFLPPPPPPLNLGSTTKASAAPAPPPADCWGEAPEEAAARDVWQRYVDQTTSTSRDIKVSADLRENVDDDDDSSEANSLYDGFELLDQYGGPVRRPEAGVPVDNTSNDVQRAGALQLQEEGAAAGVGQVRQRGVAAVRPPQQQVQDKTSKNPTAKKEQGHEFAGREAVYLDDGLDADPPTSLLARMRAARRGPKVTMCSPQDDQAAGSGRDFPFVAGSDLALAAAASSRGRQNKMGKQDYFALTAPPVHPSLSRYESRCLLRFALTSTEKRLFAQKRKGRCTHSLIDDANYEEPSYVRNEWLDGIPVSTSSSSARTKSPRNHAPRLLTFRGSGVIGTTTTITISEQGPAGTTPPTPSTPLYPRVATHAVIEDANMAVFRSEQALQDRRYERHSRIRRNMAARSKVQGSKQVRGNVFQRLLQGTLPHTAQPTLEPRRFNLDVTWLGKVTPVKPTGQAGSSRTTGAAKNNPGVAGAQPTTECSLARPDAFATLVEHSSRVPLVLPSRGMQYNIVEVELSDKASKDRDQCFVPQLFGGKLIRRRAGFSGAGGGAEKETPSSTLSLLQTNAGQVPLEAIGIEEGAQEVVPSASTWQDEVGKKSAQGGVVGQAGLYRDFLLVRRCPKDASFYSREMVHIAQRGIMGTAAAAGSRSSRRTSLATGVTTSTSSPAELHQRPASSSVRAAAAIRVKKEHRAPSGGNKEHHHHFNPVFEAPPIKGRQRTREDIKGLRSLFYLPPEPSTWPAFVGTYVRDRQSFRTGVVVEIVEDKQDLERRKEHERRKMNEREKRRKVHLHTGGEMDGDLPVQPIDHLLPKPIPRVLFNTGELEEAQAFRHADLFLKGSPPSKSLVKPASSPPDNGTRGVAANGNNGNTATPHTTHNKKPSKPRPLTHDRQMISSQTSNLYCFQLPDSKLFLTRVTPQLFLQPVRRLFYACDAALEPVFALGSSSTIMKRDQLVSRELVSDSRNPSVVVRPADLKHQLTDGDRQSQAILRLLKSLQSSRCIEQQNKEALAKFEQSVQKLAHCAAAFYGEDFLPRIVESGGSLKAGRFGGGSYRNLAGQVVTNPGMEQGDSAPVILALERKDTLFDYYELGKRTSSRINSENACSRQACVDWVFHLVKKGLGFLVHAKAHAFDQRLLKGLQTMEVLEEHYARNAAEAAASAMPTSAANIRWRLVPPARYILDKLQRAPWMQAAEYQQVLEQGYTFLINPGCSDSDSDFPFRVDRYQKLPLASQDDRALLLAAIGGRKIDGKEIARYFRSIGQENVLGTRDGKALLELYCKMNRFTGIQKEAVTLLTQLETKERQEVGLAKKRLLYEEAMTQWFWREIAAVRTACGIGKRRLGRKKDALLVDDEEGESTEEEAALGEEFMDEFFAEENADEGTPEDEKKDDDVENSRDSEAAAGAPKSSDGRIPPANADEHAELVALKQTVGRSQKGGSGSASESDEDVKFVGRRKKNADGGDLAEVEVGGAGRGGAVDDDDDILEAEAKAAFKDDSSDSDDNSKPRSSEKSKKSGDGSTSSNSSDSERRSSDAERREKKTQRNKKHRVMRVVTLFEGVGEDVAEADGIAEGAAGSSKKIHVQYTYVFDDNIDLWRRERWETLKRLYEKSFADLRPAPLRHVAEAASAPNFCDIEDDDTAEGVGVQPVNPKGTIKLNSGAGPSGASGGTGSAAPGDRAILDRYAERRNRNQQKNEQEKQLTLQQQRALKKEREKTFYLQLTGGRWAGEAGAEAPWSGNVGLGGDSGGGGLGNSGGGTELPEAVAGGKKLPDHKTAAEQQARRKYFEDRREASAFFPAADGREAAGSRRAPAEAEVLVASAGDNSLRESPGGPDEDNAPQLNSAEEFGSGAGQLGGHFAQQMGLGESKSSEEESELEREFYRKVRRKK